MNAELKQFIGNCDTCREYDHSQTKETLMPHDLPDRPWQKVGVDLFAYNAKDYLVTTDYRSNFWEIDYLPSTTSKSVINKMKAHFARYGIPDTVVSDNGPQFQSVDLNKFSETWGFDHTPSAPYNSQSNGKAESSVKAAKNMLRKSDRAREDQYLCLLNIRNTPNQDTGSSPAQKLLGRRTKTTLRTANDLLQPAFSTEVETQKLKASKAKQMFYYNRGARDLPVLEEGDKVRMKPFRLGQTGWRKATVMQRLDERSYDIEDEGGTVYRRNRVHLRKQATPSNGAAQQDTGPPVSDTCNGTAFAQQDTGTSEPDSEEVPVPESNMGTADQPPDLRRSSRATGLPGKYKDFVL